MVMSRLVGSMRGEKKKRRRGFVLVHLEKRGGKEERERRAYLYPPLFWVRPGTKREKKGGRKMRIPSPPHPLIDFVVEMKGEKGRRKKEGLFRPIPSSVLNGDG